ncbi:MAG: hypothetical protein JWM93_353 [Frankiales bacterium]|nr:hypothetical protein [Frankiales bacterium]
MRLLAALAVVLALAAVGDRVAAHFAEKAIAQRLEVGAGLSTTPAVTIAGWPFLTQLADRNLVQVDVATDDYKAGAMSLTRVQFELRDAWRSATTITAKRVTGTADVALAEIQRLAGSRATFSTAPDGLHFTASANGIRVSGTAAVSVVGSSIRIVPHVTAPATATLAAIDIALPQLPWGVSVTGAAVTAEGLTLSAKARDVDLQKP